MILSRLGRVPTREALVTAGAFWFEWFLKKVFAIDVCFDVSQQIKRAPEYP